MYLRMPGQIWDDDAIGSYNFHRWYRREDGRYLSPDPIGLEGGEPGYFGYANARPLSQVDPTGLLLSTDGTSRDKDHRTLTRGELCRENPENAQCHHPPPLIC